FSHASSRRRDSLDASRGSMSLVVAFLALLLVPGQAFANCQNGATGQSVVAGQPLTQIIESSTPPCTLNVGPGTYDAAQTALTSDSMFRISTGITVRSTNGPAATTLRVPPGSLLGSVNIQALNGRCPNGATLDGFTLTGGLWGVLVGALVPGCPSNQ